MKDTWAFRSARMRQSPSTAETAVFTALRNRIRLEPLGSTVCFNPTDGLQVVPRERMTCALWERCTRDGFVTVPDFVPRQPNPLAFYLDGPPHRRRRVKTRDNRIDACLAAQGWRAVRYPYTGRMGNARVRDVADAIVAEANR